MFSKYLAAVEEVVCSVLAIDALVLIWSVVHWLTAVSEECLVSDRDGLRV